MDGIIDKIVGNYTKDNKKRIKSIVEAVKEKIPEYTSKDRSFYKEKTEEFKNRLINGESKESIMVDALALCSAAINEINEYFPYDVQLEAAAAMQGNVVAEMKTGEGKTLVQILTAYLNALDGKSVHIVSANDYLCGRDYELNKDVFELLGLSVGLVQATTNSKDKKEAYSCDIMFSTLKNISFDYLRDNIVKDKKDRVVTRPFGHIVIDEIDSILIDEAKTPVILSPGEDSEYKLETEKDKYFEAAHKVLYELKGANADTTFTTDQLNATFEANPHLDYIIDTWNKTVHLSDKYIGDEILNYAVIARVFFEKGKNYVLADKLDKKGNVVLNEQGLPIKVVQIIDGPTGRISKSKKYMNGIQQAIEAKESVLARANNEKYVIETSDMLLPLGTCTYVDVLSMYDGGVSGMTGTSSEILNEIYGLPTYQVPTRKKNIREDETKYYLNKEEKYEAIIKDVEECYRIGRPVLIGTASVSESIEISKLLEERGIIHSVLNAENENIEASIISNAGQFGSVTVATNMAGRGTDIKLGEGVRALGGLRVIGTSRNISSRTDNQLRGRCSRQGDPGSSIYYSSLQDERVTKYTGKLETYIKNKLAQRALQEKRLGMPVQDKSIDTDLIDKSQKSDENLTVTMIREVNDYKGPLVTQRKKVYEFRNLILDCEDPIQLLIEVVIPHQLERINDMDELKVRFGDYIDLENENNIKSAKDKINTIISTKINSFANDSKFKEKLRSKMLKILDDNWIVQMQLLENGRVQWMTETLDGKEPTKHYGNRAYDEFQMMITCVFDEMLAYSFNPDMRYGTYEASRYKNERDIPIL